MNKTTMIPIAVVTIGVAAILGARVVSAQTTQYPEQTLVQKIALKFGLNQSDVQTVFDEHHKDKQTQMQAAFEERLTQLITDGKLTEAQKQAIIAKRQELADKRFSTAENWRELTAEQRKTAMQSQKQQLEEWANQNNIDLKYLFPAGGMKFGHRMMR